MPMLDGDDRILGTGGFVFYEDPEGGIPSVEIPIVGWSVRCQKFFQDATNSANYESTSQLVHPTRYQAAVLVEGSLRGIFRLSRIPPTLINGMFSGEIIPTIALYFNEQYEFGEGFFHISDMEVNSPIDGAATFECRIVSHGFFAVNTSAWSSGFGDFLL